MATAAKLQRVVIWMKMEMFCVVVVFVEDWMQQRRGHWISPLNAAEIGGKMKNAVFFQLWGVQMGWLWRWDNIGVLSRLLRKSPYCVVHKVSLNFLRGKPYNSIQKTQGDFIHRRVHSLV